MASDRIRVCGITVYGRHGVSEAEQCLGRPFLVDVELELDLSEAGKSDDLGRTVDYARVCEVVAAVNAGRCFRLLEAFAEEIAKNVLAEVGGDKVVVRVRKPHPPVGMVVEAAEVEITRVRTPAADDISGRGPG